MSHPNQPEYFVINSICPHSGDVTCVGIFEDMRAVSYRLQRMYTSCGDEYRVECFHLSTAPFECDQLTEQQITRAKYQKEERDKEAALKELAEIKANQEDSE